MAEYKPIPPKNTLPAETKPKKIEKVVNTKAVIKKKNGAEKFLDFFKSDDARSIGDYIVNDVLIPAFKKALSDIIKNGSDMIIYPGGARKSSSNLPYVSYDKKYSGYRQEENYRSTRTRSGYNFGEVIVTNRSDAEEVLDQMAALIDTYGVASVADLYEMVGENAEYTDNKYGWTNVASAAPVRVPEGYLIKLPKPIAL